VALKTLAGDAGVLLALLRGQPAEGTHAERLAAFYGPQAGRYDDFRERLLHGRAELIERLAVPEGGSVIELGGGTGRNLLFFGDRLARLGSVEVVDLCRPLLERARMRTAGMENVRVVEADACSYRPRMPADAVYFSYALTMIPDWRAAIDNALAMLKPGGMLGVVDFYVSDADPPPGLVTHPRATRAFWPWWFSRDGVRPSPDHLALLRARLPEHGLWERRAPVPYLPLVRVPYYVFWGRKAGLGAAGQPCTSG
jgi:S-adenosylmethionine-diacylgycerolhomoserine-N-methlytransferase